MKLKSTVVAIAAVFSTTIALAQLSLPPNGGNQKSVVRQYIGPIAFVEITYNSPDVAGRENIFGTVVPHGMNGFGFGASSPENPSPWRAGANENTVIEFSHDVNFQGKAVKAGKYGFHVVTAESGPWTIILTDEINAWGSFFYNPDQDVVKVEATPEEVGFHEFLTYEFTDRQADQATAALIWEKKKLPFTIEVPNNNEAILAQVESELTSATGFQFTSWAQAANWASGAGYHDKALAWADAAITAPFIGQKNFNTLQTKATVLFNKGDLDDAIGVMDEAIKEPGATAFQIHGYARQLLAQGKKDKALEVFKYNKKRFEGAWPTNYGLARGYSALGDFKNALKHIKVAKTKVPQGDTVNANAIDANIAKLEKGEDIN